MSDAARFVLSLSADAFEQFKLEMELELARSLPLQLVLNSRPRSRRKVLKSPRVLKTFPPLLYGHITQQ